MLSGLPPGDLLLAEGLEHVAPTDGGGSGGAPRGLGRPPRPGRGFGLGGGLTHRRPRLLLLLKVLFLLFLLLMTHGFAEGPPSLAQVQDHWHWPLLVIALKITIQTTPS